MAATPASPLRPLTWTDVTIDDVFWNARLSANRRASLHHSYQRLKETGRIDAFRLDWAPGRPNQPHVFWDSDVAKWVEAVACSLATHPDEELARRLEDVVDLIVSAQQGDGYLNTHFAVTGLDKRLTNLRDNHELYCAGHLIEAGVAHFLAGGQRKLLDAVCRYADFLHRTFGPDGRTGYPGHPEIELALVRLYRATGQRRYLELASYFVDERGREPNFFQQEARQRGEQPVPAHRLRYWQAHAPVREQAEAVGHAVRAMYLYCAMADLAVETGDASLRGACRRIWDSAAGRKMYLTGAVGSTAQGEAFTGDHDLPNESAYAETCASIALVFFAHRMLQMEADGVYADVMERALYNGVLAGISLDGRKFNYVNPLASRGEHHRRDWFDCACCPPNVNRLLASLGGYLASTGPDGRSLYVHLYVGGQLRALLAGQPVTLTQTGRYPWDGKVRLRVGLEQPARFDLRLRVPGWCRRHGLRVNGQSVQARVVKGYARLNRAWKDGDRVELTLSMSAERVEAHPAVAADRAHLAVQRGPLVYCLEQVDHAVPLERIRLGRRGAFRARFEPDLLDGVTILEGTGLTVSDRGWKDTLYRPMAQHPPRTVPLRFVPYYAWDNRKQGSMSVWIPQP